MNEQNLDDLGTPWVKHYDQGISANLDYERKPLYACLDESAAKYPDRTAVIFKNKRVSYKKLLETAETMAANLREHGLKPGDRVSIMLPNLPQTVIAFWAVLKARYAENVAGVATSRKRSIFASIFVTRSV